MFSEAKVVIRIIPSSVTSKITFKLKATRKYYFTKIE